MIVAWSNYKNCFSPKMGYWLPLCNFTSTPFPSERRVSPWELSVSQTKLPKCVTQYKGHALLNSQTLKYLSEQKGAYHSAKRSKRSFSSIWKLIHWNTNYRECFAIFPGRKKSYFFEIRLQQSLNALGKVTARYARAPCNKNVTRRTMMNGWVKVKSQMRNEDTIPDFKVHAFG